MDTTTSPELIDITPEDSAVPIYEALIPELEEQLRTTNPDDMIQEQQDKKASAINKLMALGLTEEEALALGGQL